MHIKRKFNDRAVSQVVSTLLTLMIVMGSVAAILFWGLPYIEERKLRSQSQNAVNSFNLMYNTVHGMIIDGPNTKGVSEVITTSDQGALTIDPYSNKLVLMYSFDSNYDFNVEGLDDDDNSFEIDMLDGDIDNVKIYWLNPGDATEGKTSKTTFRRIYNDSTYDLKCSQSFKVANNPDCELQTISLYLERRGAIYDDLNVSIYTTNNNPGGLPNSLAGYLHIPYYEIPTSAGWVECDFSSIALSLSSNNIYHIVLNTTGGACGDGVYNYYKWYLHKENYYGDTPNDPGRAFTSNQIDDNWDDEEGDSGYYDFFYRINYADGNIVPEKPTTNPSISDLSNKFYSGISNSFDLSTIEGNEDETVYFKIDWGDGTDSGWVGPHQARSVATWYSSADHIWKKPGRYTVAVKAKDENNSVSEETSATIDVIYGEHIPTDSYHFEEIGYSSPITSTEDLNGTLRIDLFDDAYPDEPATLTDKVPFGRIFVFDLGCIKYTAPYSVGKQTILFENGAVVSSGYIDNKLKSKPSFFEEDDAIAFRVIQIGKEFAGGGGIGTYRIGFKMHNNTGREMNASKVYNLKLHMSGDDQDVIDLWLNHFDNTYEFEPLTGQDNTLYYTVDGKRFLLDNSYLQAELEGLI